MRLVNGSIIVVGLAVVDALFLHPPCGCVCHRIHLVVGVLSRDANYKGGETPQKSQVV